MSPKLEFFTSDYITPVGGIILPTPGSYFKDTKLSIKYSNYMMMNFFGVLKENWYLVDGNRKMLHIAHGPDWPRALCNYIKMKPIKILPGDLFLCMECQYEFWREHNGKK